MKYAFIQLGILYQVIQGFFIYLLSSKPNILILNPIKSTKKIAIFAAYRKHYDASLDLTLGELKKRGFSIVFVSNCSLSKDFIRELKNKADIVIERGNYGRCIAAYKAGFLFLKSRNFYSAKDILFMNDTVIFPIYNADKFWKDLDRPDAQIAGIYESNEFLHHIQSFFIYCKNRVFLNPNFINFWMNYKPFNSKQLIIKYGELGFSTMCKKYNFKLYAFINLQKIVKSLDINDVSIKKNPQCMSFNSEYYFNKALDFKSNPSHCFALISLIYMNLPLLKTDLLSRNSYTFQQIEMALEKVTSKNNTKYFLSELTQKQKNTCSFFYKLKNYMGMI